MALSDPRYKILPLRGTFSALNTEVANISEGEICYATDQDQYYQKEGGVLVAVGATKAQGTLADSAVQPGDLATVATSGSYNDLSDRPAIPSATSDLTNDSGFITDAGVTQIVAGINVTIDPVDGAGAVTINASGDGTVVQYSGAAAWADTATDATLEASLNISGVTRPNNGEYVYTFTNPMPSADYAVSATSYSDGGRTCTVNNQTVSGFTVFVTGADGSPVNGANGRHSVVVHATNALPPRGGTGADAWARTSSTGDTQSSYNLACAKGGAGVYNYTFNTAMPSANYAIVCNASSDSRSVGISNNTTAGFTLTTVNSSGTEADSGHHVVVHATNAQLPDTVTQEQIDLAIAQSGSAMQPGDNISVLINDVGFITSADGGDAATLDGFALDFDATADTVVGRDRNAYITANTFQSTRSNQSDIDDASAMAFRVNDSDDNRIRFVHSRAAIRAWLLAGSGADQVGSYAFLKKVNSGSAGSGSTVNGSNLRYSSAGGNSQGTPSGTWKSMGRSLDDGNQTGEKMTTLYLRIA